MSHRDAIVAEARRWLGTPYAHQASCLGAGCDCLGLVRGVWRRLYGPEPEAPGPYAPDWALASRRETLVEAASRHLLPVPGLVFAPGDVLLFRWRARLPASHCAIATGPDTMIHAHDGAAVAEVAIGAWRSRLAFVFAFPERT